MGWWRAEARTRTRRRGWRRFGVGWASISPTHHRFYWLGPEDQAESPCPNVGGACAAISKPDHPIYSPHIPFEHEIVHVELAPQVGNRVLTEGVAEMYGSIVGLSSIDSFPVDELLEGRIPGVGYPEVGRFSRYLVEAYGMDDYFALLNAARDARSAAALDTAFRSVLDVSIDEAILDCETFSPCAAPMWRYYDYECSDLPLTPWASAEQWQTSLTLACDEPDVIGPRGDPAKIWTLRALEVEARGAYELTVEGTEPATANLEPCFRGCFDEAPGYPPSPSATTERPSGASVMDPGRYWLRVERLASSSADVTVSLRRL